MSDVDTAWKALIAEASRRNAVVAVGKHRPLIEAAIRAESAEPDPDFDGYTAVDLDAWILHGWPLLRDEYVAYCTAKVRAESAGGLNVERLERAMVRCDGVHWPKGWGPQDYAWVARQVAAEYARLTEAER